MSIDSPETLNGQAVNTPTRVKFGPGATQEIPISWAEFILTTMWKAQRDNAKPRHFGDLLQAAAMEGK
jgi:hypothetical protein